MKDYVDIERFDDDVCVTFYIDNDKVMKVGSEIEAINENAYMNGENWSALLEFYLTKKEPELLEDMTTDPEACMYAALYPYSEENEKKANRFGELICELVESPDSLLRFVEENGEEIEWD